MPKKMMITLAICGAVLGGSGFIAAPVANAGFLDGVANSAPEDDYVPPADQASRNNENATVTDPDSIKGRIDTSQ